MNRQTTEKFRAFLEALNSEESDNLLGTIIKGFEIIYKPEDSGNPHALTDDYEKPEAYYNVQKDRIRQFVITSPSQEQVIKEQSGRLCTTPEDVKEEYLLFHQDLTLDQFLEELLTWKELTEKSYYDDDKHKYFAKSPKRYATLGAADQQNNPSFDGGRG